MLELGVPAPICPNLMTLTSGALWSIGHSQLFKKDAHACSCLNFSSSCNTFLSTCLNEVLDPEVDSPCLNLFLGSSSAGLFPAFQHPGPICRLGEPFANVNGIPNG